MNVHPISEPTILKKERTKTKGKPSISSLLLVESFDNNELKNDISVTTQEA